MEREITRVIALSSSPLLAKILTRQKKGGFGHRLEVDEVGMTGRFSLGRVTHWGYTIGKLIKPKTIIIGWSLSPADPAHHLVNVNLGDVDSLGVVKYARHFPCAPVSTDSAIYIEAAHHLITGLKGHHHIHHGPAKQIHVVNNYHDAQNEVHKIALELNLDPALALAFAHHESAFNQQAVSVAGAVGVMQIMPATAIPFKMDPYNMRDNIYMGLSLIKRYALKYKDLIAICTAYRSGPGRVGHPSTGDIEYADQIRGLYWMYRNLNPDE